jgi:pentatricopeptide repeat protein
MNNVEMAWKLFYRMQTNYSYPDSVTYSLMIHVAAKDNQVEKALNLFDEMRTSRQMMTSTTVNSLLYALSKSTEFAERAQALYSQAILAGLIPNSNTFGYLMRCARKMQSWEVGQTIWREAKRCDLIDDNLRTQALWTISVAQQRLRAQISNSIDEVIPQHQPGQSLDFLLNNLDLANAYIAACIPYFSERTKLVFDQMKERNAMTFKLMLEHHFNCTEKNSLHIRSEGARIWALFEAWYTRIQYEANQLTPESDVENRKAAYLAQKHGFNVSLLQKILYIVVNGVVHDNPKAAVALILKYGQQGVLFNFRNLAPADRIIRLSSDEDIIRLWEVGKDRYQEKESRSSEASRRLSSRRNLTFSTQKRARSYHK